MKPSKKLLLVVLVLVLAVAGCGQSANESASSETGSKGAGGGSRAARSSTPPAPVTVTIPVGTEIDVTLIDGLSSKTAQPGQTFQASLDRDIVVNGQTVVAKGANVTGEVTQATASGRLKHLAKLYAKLTSIEHHGQKVAIATSETGYTEGSKTKRNILFIGGGTGGGTAIGAIAGGGKGAAIGSAIGAGGGLAGAMMTGKKDINFPPETRLRFELEQPVEVHR